MCEQSVLIVQVIFNALHIVKFWHENLFILKNYQCNNSDLGFWQVLYFHLETILIDLSDCSGTVLEA